MKLMKLNLVKVLKHKDALQVKVHLDGVAVGDAWWPNSEGTRRPTMRNARGGWASEALADHVETHGEDFVEAIRRAVGALGSQDEVEVEVDFESSED